jgi:hypothetical protein
MHRCMGVTLLSEFADRVDAFGCRNTAQPEKLALSTRVTSHHTVQDTCVCAEIAAPSRYVSSNSPFVVHSVMQDKHNVITTNET